MNRPSLIFASLALVCLLGTPTNVRSAEKPAADEKDLSPEEVARRFFIAMVSKDREALERYMLPDEHGSVLWAGPRVPEQAKKQLARQIETMQFKRLAAGDVVTGADGTRFTIEPKQVNENRMLLLPDGFKLPFALVRQADGWKVKADNIIAARQSRDKEQEKSKEQTGPPKAR